MTAQAATGDPRQPGVLVLVVGPSGAGKDTLIARAKARLGEHSGIAFARRVVTRRAGGDPEDHETASEAEFRHMMSSGAFALAWEANGLFYGIPRSIEDWLRDGRTVVANVSRSIVGIARDRFEKLVVVHVTAPDHVLAERLAARGRETEQLARQRLERAASHRLTGIDAITIDNSGPIETAASAFILLLMQTRTNRKPPDTDHKPL